MDLALTVRNLLLIGHVGSAIVLIGPMIVAMSLFPRYAAAAVSDPAEIRVAQALRRITKTYGQASIIVAVFGIALAITEDLFDQPFVGAGIALFLVVAGISVAIIEPGQSKALTAASVATGEAEMKSLLTRLRAASGVSALLVLVLVYFMVAKPS